MKTYVVTRRETRRVTYVVEAESLDAAKKKADGWGELNEPTETGELVDYEVVCVIENKS